MALTDDEKTEAVVYLGYSSRTVIPGTTEYSKIISDNLTNLGDFGERRVKKFLKRVRDVDEKIEQATERLSVTQVDDFKLNEDEIQKLRSVRKSYVKEISTVTNIPSVRSSSGVGVCL
jgi:hypothetical protein